MFRASSIPACFRRGFDMVKGDDGAWTATTTPLVEGFHYYSLAVDRITVHDPATHSAAAQPQAPEQLESGAMTAHDRLGLDHVPGVSVPQAAATRRGSLKPGRGA
jgi:hypothetical protein